MKKKTLIWILVSVVVVSLLLFLGNKNKGNRDVKEVEVSKIELITIVETVAATGKIQPEVEVMLSSEVSGEIIELPVKEGHKLPKEICWCESIPI